MLVELALLLPVVLYAWHWWARGYWRRRNVFQIDGEFIFLRVLRGEINFFENYYNKIYREHREKKLIGLYNLYQPMLLVTDPEYIKRIFVSDFNSFPSAGQQYGKNEKLFRLSPFLSSGEVWKFQRGIQTAILSPAKLKENMKLFIKSAETLKKYISKNLNKPLKIGEILKFYTIDIVTSAIFGLEPTAFVDPENGYRKHASLALFDENMAKGWILSVYAPLLNSHLLQMRFFSKQTEEFFIHMADKIFNYRKQAKVSKNDLIEHLIKINQKLESEGKKGMGIEEIASYMMTTYGDAVETSSVLLAFLFLELANRPEIQERLREEIMAAGRRLEDFDFDKIHALEYLNMVFNEIIRMHPLIPYFTRLCSQKTCLGDLEIEEGTLIVLPTSALTSDPEFFPEPENFEPNRFSPTNFSQIKGKFFPFGDGPKQCPGMKYASSQIKLAVVYILLNFRLSPVNQVSGNKVPDVDEPHIFSRPDNSELLMFEDL